MKKQTIMFTALPNGFAPLPPSEGPSAPAPRLRLSVFVSPKLMTNEGLPKPLLSQFPDFLNWPTKDVSFAVCFNGGDAVPATVVSPAPSPTLWQALFKPGTYVRPYEFPPLDTRLVQSFPVRNVMDWMKNQYRSIAVDVAKDKGNGFPGVRNLAQAFGEIATYRDLRQDPTHGEFDREKQLEAQLKELMSKSQAVPPGPPNPALDFYRVKRFYKPRNAERLAVAKPELDFHQVVAALGDYPEILRRMGLVVDLEVPAAAVGGAATGSVQVVPNWNPALGATESVTPRTHYVLADDRFLAAPRPTGAELQNGLLNLSDSGEYGVEQTDVDGAALKVLDFANNLFRAHSYRHSSADTPQAYSVPALRSGGFALVRTGRALKLVQMLKHAKQLHTAATTVDLYAEDVTRGYRIDVWDSRSETWRSLHRRQGVYKFTDGGILVSAEDEGVVSMGAAQSADGATPDLFLHETMVNWQGWSLSAPRYGKMVNNEDAAQTPPTAADPNFGLETTFHPVPRSLPKLRFGTDYRLRARAVDLAGNSRPYDIPDEAQATAPATYTRMEPVASPMTLLRSPLTQGEAAERLVIRSNYNTASVETGERHVAPPRVAQLMAETHGMFDAEAGLDKAAYDAIIAREGNFNPDATHPEATLALPYLSDPIARGAAFRGLPGTAADEMTRVTFGNAWPDRLPFRIVVEEGTGAPAFDAESRTLTVKLPKAEMVPVRLSAYLGKNDLKLMGLWQWLNEAGLPIAQLAAMRNQMLQGAHWMVTPHRTLTLVHAVQQPLKEPAYQSLKADKQLGQTHATLTDNVAAHGKSTDKLDILATWEEPVDLLSEPTWRTITGSAHAGELPVTYGTETTPLSMKHDFGDTKYRRVKYTAVATSRYKEYFPTAVPVTRETAAPTEVDVLNSARPAAPKVLYVVPAFKWSREELAEGEGSVAIRRAGGLRVYLDRPWFSAGEGELLGAVLWVQPKGGLIKFPPKAPPENLKPFVTQWGMDPIWLSNETYAIPTTAHFPQAVAIGTGLSLEEVPGSAVNVAGHKVGFDEDRKLWYCDIEIDAGNSYWPFVRLALARYQPKSVTGAHLSRVVLADFAQLAPDRLATVVFDPEKPNLVAVTVCGPGYQRSAVGRGASQIEVTVETRVPNVGGDIAWVAADSHVYPLELTDDDGESFTWSGGVTLPEDRQSKRYRLVIREYEQFLADGFSQNFSAAAFINPTARRLVYAAVLEL